MDIRMRCSVINFPIYLELFFKTGLPIKRADGVRGKRNEVRGNPEKRYIVVHIIGNMSSRQSSYCVQDVAVCRV